MKYQFGKNISQSRLGYIEDWMERYIENGRLAGAEVAVTHRNETVFHSCFGKSDIKNDHNWSEDTIARFYSMTKPITAVAMLQLYEQGLFHLDDPIELFLPEFRGLQVLTPNADDVDSVEKLKTKPTIHQLFLHTAGFSYSFNDDLVAPHYKEQNLDFAPSAGKLPDVVKRLSKLPLKFQPGTRWNYGVNTDILGRLVEVISGKNLDVYFKENILGPLGMKDTFFEIPDEKLKRLAALYQPAGVSTKGISLSLIEDQNNTAYRAGQVSCLSGGGGLLSTVTDYMKFVEMLRGGGSLDGQRILGRKTVQMMIGNHLEGDLAEMGQPVFSEISFKGIGFGLGVWSVLNPNLAGMSGSIGDFGWGGMASTVFICDPLEELSIVFATQLVPSSFYPLRKELRALVYQSLD